MAFSDLTFLGFNLVDLIIFVALLIGAVGLGKLLSMVIRASLDERMGRRFSKTMARTVFYIIVAIALTIGFGEVLRLDFTGLLVSLGILGVAIAFASQQIIGNFLSGILIAIVRPIQLEDWVEVGLLPLTGPCRVKDINLMNTVMRDVNGRLVIVPNSQIMNGKVINYTQAGFVATPIELWLDASCDMDVIRKIVLEEADRDPRILPYVDESERTIVKSIFDRPAIRQLFGGTQDMRALDPQISILDVRENKVRLNVRVWIREINNRDDIVSGFLEVLRKRFQENGIEFRDP
ncbi:MAG: mechanosensitive ion channel [Methanomassiliicoccus sp.]|nr:mechanosensitive ion channel [Methanomassiliicoccus sp.]